MAQDRNRSDGAAAGPRGRLPDGLLIGGLTLILLIVIGIFAYRMSTRPTVPDADAADRARAGGEARTPGDFDPQPKFRNTRDELEFRGEPQQAATRLSDITRVSGQRVELKDVEVESADAHSFRIGDGKNTIAVVAPAGTPALRSGEHVSVSGRVETQGGDARIEATRVERTD